MTVVHACLRDGEGGSPTVVLFENEGFWSDEDRRRVPVEAGTSHAVFIGPDLSLRFFTAAGELPACGHGTVAALALLADRTGRREHVLKVGGRAFRGRADSAGRADLGDLIAAAFDPGPIVLGSSPDISEMSAGIGLAPSGDARVATLGRPRILFPVADRAAVAALAPDLDRLRAETDRLGLLGVYVYSLPDGEGRVAARMFAPSIGVPEDIANANSTACLAAHLGCAVRADMGDALGSPATVTAAPAPDGVLVGGIARC